MTLNQCMETFKKLGIEEIDCLGVTLTRSCTTL